MSNIYYHQGIPDDALETSNKGVRAVKAFVQDQTSKALSVPFLNSVGSFTLAANTVVGSRFIDALPGHGIAVGNTVEMAELADQTFMQAQVLSVVSNTIELDSPVNYVYTPSDLTVISENNMTVDGSVVPVVFSVLPLPAQAGEMTRIIWNFESANEMDFSTFGGAPALTNGCVVRINFGDGTYYNLFNFKSNGDIIRQCFDHSFLSPKLGNSTKGFTARLTWGGQSKFGVVNRIDGSKNESLEVVVQDDLTAGNSKFNMLAQGHELPVKQ